MLNLNIVEKLRSKAWIELLFIHFVQVARALTVAILYPIMVNMGYGLTLKDSIVMVWGGLRGAVGLALALIVELDENKLPGDFRALTIFYMGTMAASTLIINGTSMPYLLKMLGTTKTSPEKLEVLLHVIKVYKPSCLLSRSFSYTHNTTQKIEI